jgi:branched-chain amino acid transport system permease protein
MSMVFGFPLPVLLGQLLIGLINGSFYAILSLGLAVIFGMLHVINFAHGTFYMLGAFAAWALLAQLGIGYWPALIIVPLIVALMGYVLERTLLSRLHGLSPLYGLLLTFGVALMIEGTFRSVFGTAGQPYPIPDSLKRAFNLGFMILPAYRAWIIVASLAACLGVWLLIERTRMGAYLRAATENSTMVQAFGVNVPRLMALTYALGIGLAAFAGVLAAPVYQVSPLMGQNIIIIVFAVVVIGGMGSILGAIVSGYALGIIEGLTKVFYPEAANTVIFVVMVLVLLVRPSGLFGRDGGQAKGGAHVAASTTSRVRGSTALAGMIALAVAVGLAPLFFYPIVVMQILCMILFAAAFNLLIGYVGLLSFGHAAFFGGAAYVCAFAVKQFGLTPELGIVAGVLFAAALGLAVGFLAIRRHGIYFAMITLAVAQMFYFLCLQLPQTGGDDGIQNVPRGDLFGVFSLESNDSMYAFVAVVFLAGVFAIWRIINSPFGAILKSIRENEQRAISLGYRTDAYKVAAFTLSAALAGLAGATKVLVFQIAALGDVSWHLSGEVILMSLLGGIGTFLGPIVGATLVVGIEHSLATSPIPVPVVLGGVFILCVLAFRRGIVGELGARLGWARSRKKS